VNIELAFTIEKVFYLGDLWCIWSGYNSRDHSTKLVHTAHLALAGARGYHGKRTVEYTCQQNKISQPSFSESLYMYLQ